MNSQVRLSRDIISPRVSLLLNLFRISSLRETSLELIMRN